MTTHFFAAPDFLELLQLWDGMRGGRAMPEWRDDMAAIPPALLPNLIITDRPEAYYLYVGAECIRRWGSDPTGRRVYGETLTGPHSRYIKSLGDDVIARRTPIFSAAVYEPDNASVIMTGRLYVPFTHRGSDDPRIIMTLQLFQGSTQTLRKVGLQGIVHEIRRDMVAVVPALCARLAAAQRHYQISRHTHLRTLAQDIDALANELTGSVLVPLPCLEDPEPVA